jgi:hypothetical protein
VVGLVIFVVGKVRVELAKDLLAVVGRLQVEALVLGRAQGQLKEGVIGGATHAVPADAALGGLQDR